MKTSPEHSLRAQRLRPVVAPEPLIRIPAVNPRRPLDDDRPEGYLESLDDWYRNNQWAVAWMLTHEGLLRLALSGLNGFLLDRYTCGCCYHLAAALLSMRPKWRLQGDEEHAWVLLPEDHMLDIEGLRRVPKEWNKTPIYKTVNAFFRSLGRPHGLTEDYDLSEVKQAMPIAAALLDQYRL